ncbi:hypothetical protein ACLECX_02175 [Lonsdalea quercina]|uniref:hypothetical protein n=2 Tax=Lonsdalea quercina TaxID=71657 RepID=UPI0039754AB1
MRMPPQSISIAGSRQRQAGNEWDKHRENEPFGQTGPRVLSRYAQPVLRSLNGWE